MKKITKRSDKVHAKKLQPMSDLPPFYDGGYSDVDPSTLLPFQQNANTGAYKQGSIKSGPTTTNTSYNLNKGLNTISSYSGVLSGLGNAVSTDWSTTEGQQQGVEGIVETVLPFVPVVGPILSTANQITEPVGDAIKSSNRENDAAYAGASMLDFVGTFSRGVSELIDGNWKAGLADIFAPGFGGILESNRETEARVKQEQNRSTQSKNFAISRNKLNEEAASVIAAAFGGSLDEMSSGGKIHIKPENRGKFTAYKKRTGKTTEEALHSKDPHVRKMANFAKNARKWHHKAYGGPLSYDVGGSHETNPYGGIPIDRLGNPASVSGNPAVATTEEGEVTIGRFVFTNRF